MKGQTKCCSIARGGGSGANIEKKTLEKRTSRFGKGDFLGNSQALELVLDTISDLPWGCVCFSVRQDH